MVEDKTSPDEIERVLSDALSRQDVRQVVRQMLAGAPKRPFSQNRANRSRRGEAAADEAARYEEAFRNTERRLAAAHERVRRERHLAGVQWASLEGHPPARRLIMVRNDERLHHWGLYDLLLEKSREAAQKSTAAAVSLAELALAVAERLDPEVYGGERLADFKTAALAALGNARRLAGDFAGARLAFSQARIHLEMGTGDLLEEAALLGGLVSLLCDLGEYEKAAQSLERASALYRRLGDDPLNGISIPGRQEEETDEDESRQGLRTG
ncbi:MAG TPA: hypothetical protein VGG03_13900 [Thermoanaerobaculia bacterium]|jgi:tetratricopeptide (TPR) repeat protein